MGWWWGGQQKNKEPCKKEACDIQACLSKNNFNPERYLIVSSFSFHLSSSSSFLPFQLISATC
ncbi:hypothetical protein BHE74_00046146 [Ensete ventricosum]|uniref:Uncharacterized protein n=1 Tax=Ensete ventricosum TaxID=4639 RepID=A0A444CTE3_ENSVE|nr:hypothetical protein B296_00047053 [Ensete ventricosum]RWV89157.1 hypothetical protein GW17_00048713 [Ensete ventricosum]RWW47829.1 hypothetical protein BHE74_00046146 [Ensete ventricosum]RZS19305.1 hypothetical protein BHM03_00051677 [Ensete ventricosum]